MTVLLTVLMIVLWLFMLGMFVWLRNVQADVDKIIEFYYWQSVNEFKEAKDGDDYRQAY